jgi:hypothetical protein
MFGRVCGGAAGAMDSHADFFGKPRSDTVPDQRGKRREPKGLSHAVREQTKRPHCVCRIRLRRRHRARRVLERFPAKWTLVRVKNRVRVKKTRQNKKLESRSDSIGTEKALAGRSSIACLDRRAFPRGSVSCAARQDGGCAVAWREVISACGVVAIRLQSLPEQKKRPTAQASTRSVFDCLSAIVA